MEIKHVCSLCVSTLDSSSSSYGTHLNTGCRASARCCACTCAARHLPTVFARTPEAVPLLGAAPALVERAIFLQFSLEHRRPCPCSVLRLLLQIASRAFLSVLRSLRSVLCALISVLRSLRSASARCCACSCGARHLPPTPEAVPLLGAAPAHAERVILLVIQHSLES